jgi:hypothetical protein
VPIRRRHARQEQPSFDIDDEMPNALLSRATAPPPRLSTTIRRSTPRGSWKPAAARRRQSPATSRLWKSSPLDNPRASQPTRAPTLLGSWRLT